MSLVEQGVTTPVQPVTVQTPAVPTEQKLIGFWNKFKRPFLIGLAGGIVAGGAYLAYENFVVAPNEAKAQESMYVAQDYFAKDSFALAMKGSTNFKGFEFIAREYGSTKSGKLAHYYTGICALHTGEYQKAVDHLSDFSTNSAQISMMANGALGDAYSELKKTDEAIGAYKKAATAFEKDETASSEYLFRAALLSEIAGKNEDAIALYRQLKQKFPRSEKGFSADKYLYRLSAEKNEFSVK